MANSFVRYTGNGSTDVYAVSFPYRSQSDITVTIDGVATTAFTWNGAGTQITFTSPPGNLTSIQIKRTTSQTSRLVDYAAGSVLTENDLDTDSTQAFYIGQEAVDEANDRIIFDIADFNWDAQSKRIKNVADPTANTDAVNKQFISTNLPNINTVAGIAADVTTVAGIAANVTAVAGDATDIGVVAGKATEIGRLGTADAVADMALLGTVDCIADMAQLASTATIADLAMLAETDIVADLAQLATTDFVSDLNLLATSDFVADLTAIEAVKANVTTCADNLTGINNFAEKYRQGATNPVSSLDEGDLFYNESDNLLKYYNGTSWTAISSGGIASVADDLSPQLGADLDLNGFDIPASESVKGFSIAMAICL